MSGGMAPTTAPTQVLKMLSCFMGVYTPAYSTMLAAPSAVVNGLVCRPGKVIHTPADANQDQWMWDGDAQKGGVRGSIFHSL